MNPIASRVRGASWSVVALVASIAATSASAATLKSLHMTLQFRHYTDGKVTETRSESWYDGADKMKLATTNADSEDVHATTSDQVIHYRRLGTSRVALIRPAADVDREMASRSFDRLRFVRPTDSKELVSAYASRFNLTNVRITGTKTVAGRTGDVVEGRYAGDDTRRFVEIVDRETGVALAETIRKGKDLVRTYEAVVFDANKPIPDDVFEPEFPAGTVVFRGAVDSQRFFESSVRGYRDASQLEKELAMSPACDINYPVALEAVYIPGYIPSGYKLLHTGAGHAPAPIDTWETEFVNPDTGDTIVVQQQVAEPALAAAAGTSTAGQLVQSDKFRGFVTTSAKPYSYTTLRFFPEGWNTSGLTLTSTSLGQDEMVKIAKSMAPSESAAKWLGKRHAWHVTGKVLGNPDAGTVQKTVSVIQKRIRCVFGPRARVETANADAVIASASSNNPSMGELLTAAVTMPGHIRLVAMPKGTKVNTGHMAEAERVIGPADAAIPESEILKYKDAVLDETDLVYKRYPFADGGYWDRVEIAPASQEKAAHYAKSHPGQVLAIVLDGEMVLGYVTRGLPSEVAIAASGQKSGLFKAVLQSGLLPAQVEAGPVEEIAAAN